MKATATQTKLILPVLSAKDQEQVGNVQTPLLSPKIRKHSIILIFPYLLDALSRSWLLVLAIVRKTRSTSILERKEKCVKTHVLQSINNAPHFFLPGCWVGSAVEPTAFAVHGKWFFWSRKRSSENSKYTIKKLDDRTWNLYFIYISTACISFVIFSN